MASSLPVIRQVAWLSLVPQLAVMGTLIFSAHALGLEEPVIAGALAYLALSFTLRRAIPGYHRKGMMLYRQERFAEAIPEFRHSYEFFVRHPGLDRWRSLTTLSSSGISYREMALANTALCLGQIGEREQALAEYRKTLAEFPNSKLAQTAIRMLEGHSNGNRS